LDLANQLIIDIATANEKNSSIKRIDVHIQDTATKQAYRTPNNLYEELLSRLLVECCPSYAI
jgi:hypothetical protein